MPQTSARSFWAPVICQVVLSLVFAAALFELQVTIGLGWWVLNLAAFGPLLAGVVTLVIGRRLNWPVRFEPGIGLDARVIRRAIALVILGLAVAAGATQVYAALRWPLKHVIFGLKPHPFLSELADPMWYLMWIGLGLLVAAAASEFAWRTILQPTLRQRLGVLETAVVMGLAWGAVQMPWLQGVWRRVLGFTAIRDAVIYLVFLALASVGMALIVVIFTDPLKRGRWFAGICFQWPMTFLMYLVLDEELGRWQAMAALAISTLLLVSGVYAVYRRGLPSPLGDPDIWRPEGPRSRLPRPGSESAGQSDSPDSRSSEKTAPAEA